MKLPVADGMTVILGSSVILLLLGITAFLIFLISRTKTK